MNYWDYTGGGNYLSHHGIDGQKWGQRNGPPYPLSRKSPSKRVAKRYERRINDNLKKSAEYKSLADAAKTKRKTSFYMTKSNIHRNTAIQYKKRARRSGYDVGTKKETIRLRTSNHGAALGRKIGIVAGAIAGSYVPGLGSAMGAVVGGVAGLTVGEILDNTAFADSYVTNVASVKVKDIK